MAAQHFGGVRNCHMGKGKKTKTAVYHPPKSGMPYLVVTVAPEGVTATACESKDEASCLKEDNGGLRRRGRADQTVGQPRYLSHIA